METKDSISLFFSVSPVMPDLCKQVVLSAESSEEEIILLLYGLLTHLTLVCCEIFLFRQERLLWTITGDNESECTLTTCLIFLEALWWRDLPQTDSWLVSVLSCERVVHSGVSSLYKRPEECSLLKDKNKNKKQTKQKTNSILPFHSWLQCTGLAARQGTAGDTGNQTWHH